MDNDIIIDDMNMEAAVSRVDREHSQTDSSAPQSHAPELSMTYILSKIESIADDAKYFREALDSIKEIPVSEVSGGNSFMGDIAGQAKAEAIGQSVQAREATNQQLIRLLEKMYDDLRPKEPTPPSRDELMLQQLSSVLSNLPSEYAVGILQKAAQQMFVRAGAAIV